MTKIIQTRIKSLDEDIEKKRVVLKKITAEITSLFEEKKALERRVLSITSKDYITEHCLMRYAERIYKFDLESIRKEIMKIKGLEEAILLGVSKFKKDNKTFILNNGKIITIY